MRETSNTCSVGGSPGPGMETIGLFSLVSIETIEVYSKSPQRLINVCENKERRDEKRGRLAIEPFQLYWVIVVKNDGTNIHD